MLTSHNLLLATVQGSRGPAAAWQRSDAGVGGLSWLQGRLSSHHVGIRTFPDPHIAKRAVPAAKMGASQPHGDRVLTGTAFLAMWRLDRYPIATWPGKLGLYPISTWVGCNSPASETALPHPMEIRTSLCVSCQPQANTQGNRAGWRQP